MTIILKDLRTLSLYTIMFTTLLIVSGCGKSSSINNQTSVSASQVQYYIKKARQSNGEERADWLLLAAEALLSQQRTDKALAVLNSVSRKDLTTSTLQLYHLLMAQGLSSANRTDQALAQYIQISQPDLLKKYQKVNYYRDFAEILNQLFRHYDSALQRIALSELITDPLETEENRELLWQSLMQVTNLEIYRSSLNSALVSGWLELAYLAKTHAEQPDILLTQLENWRALYNDHPANIQLPIDMARAEAARSYRPESIALLLPETGSLATSAKQIRDGFLAAIYQMPIDKRPDVLFYDSSKSSDIKSLYQKAIDQGASFVIGPLRRESVEDLASLEQFPVPVMTINRLADDLILPQNFYQFGLPVEDEARQAATKAWEDGFKRAIILVPNGTVGERTSLAFTEQFERLGGEIQHITNYGSGDDYSRAVQELLGVDKSLARYSRLQQILGVPIKHEARRRQDSDFLFFKASVQQARRIKPFIDFYYAHDLPLYSTSSIYNGKEDPLLDRDLDKVLFCDIPWLLTNDFNMVKNRQQISAIWPDSTQSRSARLFALGYDLFTLIPELSKLRNFPLYQKQGLSGLLSVNQSGHVQRTLSWARFINGKATLIEDNKVSFANHKQQLLNESY